MGVPGHNILLFVSKSMRFKIYPDSCGPGLSERISM